MCFAKRNAYLCFHAKLYNFINFASFLMLLTHIFGTADTDCSATAISLFPFLNPVSAMTDNLLLFDNELSFNRY